MKNLTTIFTLTVFLIFVFGQAAFAYDRSHHGHWRGDIRHFNDYDRAYWQRGHWHHGPHGGHDGWWWVTNNGWYFYPKPIYPYPNPFIPAPVIVAAPGAVAPAPLPTLVAAHYYYCSNPHGYYPYVAICHQPWHAVVTP